MKELKEKWKEFKQECDEKEKKINARMSLWYSENPMTPANCMSWNSFQKIERYKLENQFDYEKPTVENFLNWLIK